MKEKEIKILVIDNLDYSKIKKEIEEKYEVQFNYSEKMTKDLTRDCDFIFIQTNSSTEVDEYMKKKYLSNKTLIMITQNLNERFLWYSSRYFGDIIAKIHDVNTTIRRLEVMFSTEIKRRN